LAYLSACGTSITNISARIATFQISSILDHDCCQLFGPKHPATKARFSEVEADETKLDAKELALRSGKRH
jgi:tRNA uracil 4-sulfurtransferase